MTVTKNMLEKTVEDYLVEFDELIHKLAMYHRVYGLDIDDLEQEFRMILVQNYENYDPNKGASFKTFFISSCKRAVKRMRSKMKNLPFVMNLDETENTSNSDLYNEVVNILDNIPNGNLVLLHFVHGYSSRKLAKMMGVSKTEINFRIHETLEKLQKILAI